MGDLNYMHIDKELTSDMEELTSDINNKTVWITGDDLEFSLHIFSRLTRRHAAKLILLHCMNMKQILLLFIIYIIHYILDKELQTMDNTSGMDPIYGNVGQYVSGYWIKQ